MEYLSKQLFDVPRLDKDRINADATGWGDAGFCVNTLARKSGPERTPVQFDPTFRLAWNDQGLLLLAIVHDTTPVEHDSIEDLYRKDSLEIVVSAGVGSVNRYQVVIAPGVAGQHTQPRMRIYDRRDVKSPAALNLVPTIASRKTKDGYVLEALLPLPARDDQSRCAINVVFNDANDDAASPPSRYSWFPADTSSVDPTALYALRLANHVSPPIQAAVSRTDIEHFRRLQLFVMLRNPPNAKTLPITVHNAGRVITRINVDLQPGLREYQITLPMPTIEQPYDDLILATNDALLTPVPLQDILVLRRRALFDTDFFTLKSVFAEDFFPRADFASPNRAEDVGGRYTVNTRYFDADYNEVAKPDKSGRYGAISVVTTTEAGTATFYRTLYRLPKPFEYYGSIKADIEFPPSFGLDPAVVKARQCDVEQYVLRNVFHASLQGNDRFAALLCGLAEANPNDPPVARFSANARDHQWWYGLKKKIGLPTGYPTAVELPADYDDDQETRWPLLVWLHGASERGDEHGGDPKTWHSRSAIATFAQRTGRRFIVVMPANAMRELGWKPIQVMDVIADVSAKYRVDPDRIYLAGSSMGGFGTWATATTYPEKFAAIAPVCGIGDPADMAQLKDLPIWVVHGEQDFIVPIAGSKQCVEALHKLGGRVRCSFPNAGHNVPIPAELYDWFLEQHRGNPTQKPGETQS